MPSQPIYNQDVIIGNKILRFPQLLNRSNLGFGLYDLIDLSNQFQQPTNVWYLGGNNSTGGAYLGTNDNTALPLATNAVIRGSISGIGVWNIAISNISISSNSLLNIGNATNMANALINSELNGGNTFLQNNIKNTNAGTSASTDIVVTANTGTQTTNYGNFGINSSTYSDALFSISGALDTYLYSNGGNLVVGTQSLTKIIKFHTGGTLSTNERVRITDTTLSFTGTPFTINNLTTNGAIIINTNAAGTLTLDSGTIGSVFLGTGNFGKSVAIGNNTAGTNISITTAASFTLQGVGATVYSFGSGITTGTLNFFTGAMVGAANLLNGSGTQVINIANAGIKTSTFGSSITTSTTTINGGTGGVNINSPKLFVKQGPNFSVGTATLVAGTVTVSNTNITANSQIQLTAQNASGTIGDVRITAKVVGTSFTITSSSATDTSTIFYQIIDLF